MGYTHYWYRKPEIDPAKFAAILADFNKIVIVLDDMKVRLGDGIGENIPVLTHEEIIFNGFAHCGHPKNGDVCIPWPAKGASGVDRGVQSEKIAGEWFAGALLATRTCNGDWDCSYETMSFPRVDEVPEYYRKDANYLKTGLMFACCKTAYRPYDLAVTSFLIIAKHHLGDEIKVSSDGKDENWQEAKQLCTAFLGYGNKYRMLEEGLEITA